MGKKERKRETYKEKRKEMLDTLDYSCFLLGYDMVLLYHNFI